MEKKIWIWTLFAGIFLLGGCRSSYISGSWKTSQPLPGQYDKVMVLGLIRDEDSSLRIKMEDHMVGDLVRNGIRAISAYRSYGVSAFDGMTEGEAVDFIRESGIDAIITIVLVNKDEDKRSFEGHPRYWPEDYYDTKFWQYYKGMRKSIYAQDYYVINTRYLWESNFYDMNNQALIYTVQTQSFDPISTEELAHGYGKTIVKRICRERILKKQRETVTRAF